MSYVSHRRYRVLLPVNWRTILAGTISHLIVWLMLFACLLCTCSENCWQYANNVSNEQCLESVRTETRWCAERTQSCTFLYEAKTICLYTAVHLICSVNCNQWQAPISYITCKIHYVFSLTYNHVIFNYLLILQWNVLIAILSVFYDH